ncbi:MAG: hypothetical protein GY708_24105 [Actinomycetia bacterium]|nr:hypothetical protein [Actinomycetes bacterium]MCP4962376.1 hypothetical protein [Actinomycetes bacterium]
MRQALRRRIAQILRLPPSPTRPSPSFFGSDADRRRADTEREQEWERAIAYEKGRPRGF